MDSIKRGRGKPLKEPYKITPFSLSLRALSVLSAIAQRDGTSKTRTLEDLIFEAAARRGIPVPEAEVAS